MMNAKDAAIASEEIALRESKRILEEKQKAMVDHENRERSARQESVVFFLDEFHKTLLYTINQNRRSCHVTIQHPVTAQLVAENLSGRGFIVSKKCVHHPEEKGSADDLYAYAHDAYDEWVLTVSW